MPPRRKQATSKKAAPGKTQATARTTRATTAAATRTLPPRAAAGRRQAQAPPADQADGDTDEEDGPPQRPTRKTTTKRKDKIVESSDEDEDADEAILPPAKKPTTAKAKARSTQRATKRPRDDADEDRDEEDGNANAGSPRRSKRAKRADSKAPATIVDDEDAGDGAADEQQGEANNDVGSGDDAEDDRDDPFEEINAIATRDSRTAVTFEEQDAELTVSLKVFNDPDPLRSRLGYRAQFSLTRPAADSEVERLTNVVGYIDAWRIAKRTANLPEANHLAFIQELTRNGTKRPNIRETSICMAALYTEKGEVRQKLDDGIIAQLNDNPLIFIEMIYIRPAFQGRRLLRSALDCFYQALAELPEWFAFAGTIVLIPGRPKGRLGDSHEGKEDEDVEKELEAIYERLGYTIYIKDGKARGHTVTVMGKLVPVREETDE